MKKNKTLTFIDLFAGCGGLSEGFLQSGHYEALAHVEWEVPMVNTLRHRLENKWKHSEEEAFKRTVHFDIQKVDELINGKWAKDTIVKYGKTNHKFVVENGLKGLTEGKKVNLIIGGPPCQAYSVAGRAQDKNSMKEDYRNYLFESFIKVVDAFQPELFVFENVPGILSASPGGKKVTERIFESFSAYGYEILKPENLKNAILSSSNFGVAQNRNRVIIIGIRKGLKSTSINLEEIYSAIRGQQTSEKKTLIHAIGNLPKFIPAKSVIQKEGRKISHQPLEIDIEVPVNHEPRFHNERDIKIFREWVSKDMNNRRMDEKILFYNNLLGKNSKHAKYRNLEWHKPSQTIVAHLNKDGLMFIHPDSEQARTITVKEAALIQSFPDDFEFKERMGHNYKMIGNAVPPLMAKHIASAVHSIVKDY